MLEGTEIRSSRHDKHDALRVTVGIGIVGICAAVASRPKLDPLEGKAFRMINRLPSQGVVPLRVIMQAGALGSAFVTAGLAFAAGNRRLARDLASSGIVAWLIAKAVKAAVARERPAALLGDVTVHGEKHTGLGFPSGHAAVSAALAAAAAPYLPKWGRQVTWSIAGLVSLARIYVGAHLPIDIIGGVPLGVISASVARIMWGLLGVDASASVQPVTAEAVEGIHRERDER